MYGRYEDTRRRGDRSTRRRWIRSTISAQGKVVEAEEMYVRALRGYKKAFGTDHPRTQIIARNLCNRPKQREHE